MVLANATNSGWTEFDWRRRLETIADDGQPTLTMGPDGTLDGICQPGELTDLGRKSTYALGQRLRKLYVNQLGFMPASLSDSNSIYLRTTPVPRALESLQQAFVGFFPPEICKPAVLPPTIITRSPADETMYPNDGVCRRFAELSRAFGRRAADRWNDSTEMAYISKKVGKWMPEGSDGRVKVDSKPRLSGVMDTISSTDAHGPQTKLPKEFYDSKMREYISKIAMEEWFAGYKESREYRSLGIGALVGDTLAQMIGSIEDKNGRNGQPSHKFAMYGCHDTTLAATLSSLGCFENESWPPYTSHVAFELFQHKPANNDTPVSNITSTSSQQQPSLWSRFFGFASTQSSSSDNIGRTPLSELAPPQVSKLDGHYVRIRYNDRVMSLPGCAAPGKHLEGEPSFCTLQAFKAIVDDFAPRNWKAACAKNIGKSAFPEQDESAGRPAGSY